MRYEHIIREVEGLGDSTVIEKVKFLYRKFAYLEANKWLLDQGVIEKYKTKRPLEQYGTKGYNRLICNLVKLLVAKSFNGVTQITQVRKIHDMDKLTIVIQLDDEGDAYRHVDYNGLVRPGSPSFVLARDIFKGAVEQFCAAQPLLTSATHNLLRGGQAEVRVLYESLDLITVKDQAVSIQNFNTLLRQMREHLWPVPVTPAVVAPIETTEG